MTLFKIHYSVKHMVKYFRLKVLVALIELRALLFKVKSHVPNEKK